MMKYETLIDLTILISQNRPKLRIFVFKFSIQNDIREKC